MTPTISFLSDYGLADEFVGVVKSVIRQIAPDTPVIDITHEVPPHDVRAGALTLARAVQYLAPGVVLAVVDPGVGTSRRAVVVEVAGGEAHLVGPDNGLLAPAVAMVGGATRAVELKSEAHRLPGSSATFDGRDVFGPAAAHLCNGVALDELGPDIDPITLMPGILPLSRREGDVIEAEVLWVDRFGNAQLNVDPAEIEGMGDRLMVTVDGRTRSARPTVAYGDLSVGEVGLVVDSVGLVSVALDRRSASDELGLHAGAAVSLTVAGDEAPGAAVGVTLGRRSGG